MKKTLLSALIIALCSVYGYAQLNMTLRSQLEYDQSLNDIWGWADPETGIEYAIVGLRNGTSIVSLEDPDNAVEVAYIPGPSSTWRDMKTWGNFAYVSNETADGLLVIDMSQLPDAAPFFEWQPDLPGLGTLSTIHNLYIDEFGYCYITGSNLNNGGVIIVDVTAEDGTPEYVSAGPAIYAHDAYTVSNILYASEIYLGHMAIYDVTDRTVYDLQGTQPTPFDFTHNVWLNEDETVAFTTDERANAPVAAYDVTDFANTEELDQYRPVASVGSGVIPHNVHVWNDYLLISYYTDGGRVVDASRPTNLIEVGNYDTWLGGDGGFSGAWGLYPFLPSQLVLVSDINNGLFVLEPDFVRACWLEGVVIDSITEENLIDVTVVIDSEQPNLAETDIFGEFATGQAIPGTFDVTFTKPGYMPKTISVELENGVLTEVDVELVPFGTATIGGQTIEEEVGTAVAGTQVVFIGDELSYTATADASGAFTLSGIVEGTYDVYAAQWGYLHVALGGIEITDGASLLIQMPVGYQDDFFADLGWTVETTAETGNWERGEPVGTDTDGTPSNPDFDVQDDIGDECFVTGNGGGGVGDDDVDNGTVTLVSPSMDLSEYIDPGMDFSYWFFNAGGFTTPDDELSILVRNGITEAEVFTTDLSIPGWLTFTDLRIKEYVELTDNVQVVIVTADGENGHLVEAGFDAFFVEERGMVNTFDAVEVVALNAFPNPFNGTAVVDYVLPTRADQATLRLYNTLGQLVESTPLLDTTGRINVGHGLPAGTYLAKLEVAGEMVETLRLMKL